MYPSSVEIMLKIYMRLLNGIQKTDLSSIVFQVIVFRGQVNTNGMT